MSNYITIGDNVTFNGDFVVGKEIQNSFNKAQQAVGIQDELKGLLEQLALAVAPVAEALPSDKAKQLAQDLSTFTSEVTSENPRHKWWELSLEGIKEAALAAGEVGKTALDLAAKVAPLLLP